MATPEEQEFFQALKRNDEDAVKHFIEEKGIRVTITNFEQQTPAHIAVETGNLSLLKYLLSKDRELLTAVDNTNRNVLHVAIRKGALDIVRYLIDDLKLDILASENRLCGDTALHIAVEEDQLEIVKYLLEEKRVDVNVKDELGAPPIFQAAEKVRMRMMKYLVETIGANTVRRDFQEDNILYRSARIGDLTVPKYLLDERNVKIDVDWSDNFGRTILHSAAVHNHLDFIKYFVEEKHAILDLSNKLGWTAIHLAANEGHIDIVKYLVSKGARTDLKNMQRKTPLDVAKGKEVIDYLNEVTNKTRTRRNAPERRYASLTPSKLHPAPRAWIRKMITSSSGINSNENVQDQKSSDGLSQIQSLLVIANTVTRNVKYLPHSNCKQADLLLSPQEIVESKMDRLAIKAVKTNIFSI